VTFDGKFRELVSKQETLLEPSAKMYGDWPLGEVDHANMVRDDNRIINLRDATMSQNKANTRLWAHNTSGFKGVYRQKWVAYINADGKRIHIGCFDCPRAANAARVEKARSLFGEFARDN
jgi:hypothetical protein